MKTLLFLLFPTVLVRAAAPAPSQAPAHPNVLIIAVDDLKPLLSCYGEGVPTPNIDRIAAKGTVFLSAYCQQAVCGPSRASLLTGRRPDYTRVWDLHTLIRDVHPDVVTLPQFFRDAGYATTGTGKIFDPRSVDESSDARSWSVPFRTPHDVKTSDGVTAVNGYRSPDVLAAYAALDTKKRKPGFQAVKKKLSELGLWRSTECLDVPDDAYDDGAIASNAVAQLGALTASDKPFFLAVGFKKPHLPFVAPKKYWDKFDASKLKLADIVTMPKDSPAYAAHDWAELRVYSDIPAAGPVSETTARRLVHGYYACVAYVDAQVGRVLDALEKSGAAKNTIVVLWGDHGWHLGDHGLWCKHTNLEQATRAPLIIAAPGSKAPGGRVTTPVEFVDVFPTLVALAGVKPHATPLDGVSLAASLDNPAAPTKPFAISQYPRGKRMGYALRDARHRLVAWYKSGDMGFADGATEPEALELYDYAVDPLETRNLAATPEGRDIAARLAAEVKAFLLKQRT